jgi:hypothetical protein
MEFKIRKVTKWTHIEKGEKEREMRRNVPALMT